MAPLREQVLEKLSTACSIQFQFNIIRFLLDMEDNIEDAVDEACFRELIRIQTNRHLYSLV